MKMMKTAVIFYFLHKKKDSSQLNGRLNLFKTFLVPTRPYWLAGNCMPFTVNYVKNIEFL